MKETMPMNVYADLVTRIWVLREQRIVTLYEQDLYTYLLHRCLKVGANPFTQSSQVLCTALSINRSRLNERRNKLVEMGLITLVRGCGGRGRHPSYTICGLMQTMHSLLNPSVGSEACHLFVKPSLDEVLAYCRQEGNAIDGNRFFYYYESRDWYMGKNKMTDWRSAVKSWELTERNIETKNVKREGETDYVRF